jgi:uncharacterized membrane protein YgcG
MSRQAACLALLCALGWLAPAWLAPAHAQERILAYDSEVQVNADGSLEVTERIRVRAEGNSIRRGIYRDFPTRYRDGRGNRVVVGFDMRDVLRDGRAEPWFTEQQSNGVRINTGNDDLLPVPAEYTYTLRYRTTRQLGFFDDFDELYWNAIGTGWEFPIETARVDVRLPAPVAASALQLDGYTGPQGAKARLFEAQWVAPGLARWTLSGPLAPREGLTVVLGFPKGIVTAPTRAQRTAWLLKDNRGVLVALGVLGALLAYCVQRWRSIGRDPRPGTIIARYEPPQGYSPAALRFIQHMGHDARGVSADLLDLAVKGYLRIERKQAVLTDSWTLQRLRGADASLPDSQRQLLAGLGDKDRIDLKQSSAPRLQAAQQAHRGALKQAYDGTMFRNNPGASGIAAVIGFLGFGLALLVSGGNGLPLIFLLGALILATIITFAIVVRAPTPQGRELLDQIAGLRLYLGVAEQDDIARLPGPQSPPLLDAGRYEQLLPYAVALDVEDAWTKKFTLAVGAAAAAAVGSGIAWYHGGGASDLGSLTKSIGSSFTSQISSASTPPGSSSGGGGGGFSGGGGGGGGGGGR